MRANFWSSLAQQPVIFWGGEGPVGSGWSIQKTRILKMGVEKTIHWDICHLQSWSHLLSVKNRRLSFALERNFLPQTWGYDWNTRAGDIWYLETPIIDSKGVRTGRNPPQVGLHHQMGRFGVQHPRSCKYHVMSQTKGVWVQELQGLCCVKLLNCSQRLSLKSIWHSLP